MSVQPAANDAGPATSVEVALFPLNVVLFPGGLLPLRLFEQRYLRMAKECMRSETPFGVCLIRAGREVGQPATPAEIGCLARIRDWDMTQLGMLNIVARGEARFRVLDRSIESDGLARARIEILTDFGDGPIPDSHADTVRVLKMALEKIDPRAIDGDPKFESSLWVANRLAECLPLPLPARQELLEISDAGERLEAVQKILIRAGLAAN